MPNNKVDRTLDFWEATQNHHAAGQQLLRKLEWLSDQMREQPAYVRSEIAEILDLARRAVI